jgi:hypothetical protein
MWTEGDNGRGRERKSMFSTSSEMLRKGGLRLFFIGTAATVCRDAVFGMCFAGARHELPKIFGWKGRTDNKKSRMFLLDFVAASGATALSSPFNYVRNIHYSMPAGHALTIPSHAQILRNLWFEGQQQRTTWLRIQYMGSQLRVGWGTARVGCGMGLASQLYSICKGFT